MNQDARCPCGTGEPYGNCCARFHNALTQTGALTAPTPEALMRSRFSAFAVADVDYLLASWHVSTRPRTLELDESLRWVRLDILGASGGVFADTGTVEFMAHYRSVAGTPQEERVRGTQHENSRFVRESGQWFYVDGEVK